MEYLMKMLSLTKYWLGDGKNQLLLTCNIKATSSADVFNRSMPAPGKRLQCQSDWNF